MVINMRRPSRIQQMIEWLNTHLVPLVPAGCTAYLAGSILEPWRFRHDSDVDIFLRGSEAEQVDLAPFMDLAVQFQQLFGHLLSVYPTSGFRGDRQVALPYQNQTR